MLYQYHYTTSETSYNESSAGVSQSVSQKILNVYSCGGKLFDGETATNKAEQNNYFHSYGLIKNGQMGVGPKYDTERKSRVLPRLAKTKIR